MGSTVQKTLIVIAALAAAGCSDKSPVSGTLASRGHSQTVDAARGAPERACDDLAVAPDAVRVDLATPAFTNPVDISNPLFPVNKLDRAVFVGVVDGDPFRSEMTRLPGTRAIEVGGESIQTVTTQSIEWRGRQLRAIVIRCYAEDDDGNVWLLAEDIYNYHDGVLVDMRGSWVAGVDAAPAMIMPFDPQVGNVWRARNACPARFVEVTAIEAGSVAAGPRGAMGGNLVVQELRLDGMTGSKSFAPGYGRYSTRSGSNVETLGVAVPADARLGGSPAELAAVSAGADRMFTLADLGAWRRIAALSAAIASNWRAYEEHGVSACLADEMNRGLLALESAIRFRDRGEVRQASTDIARTALDFRLQYEDRAEIDIALIDVWSRQLRIDQQQQDRAAIRSDLETLRAIQNRLDDPIAGNIHPDLVALCSAALAGNTTRLEQAANRIAATSVPGGQSR